MVIDTRHTQKVMIATGFITLLVIGAYGFFFYKIKTEVESVSAVTAELEKEKEKLSTLDSTKRMFSETSGPRAKLDSFFVDQAGVVDFIQKLEELGKYSGAEVTLKNLNEKKAEGLTFSVAVDGTFSEVMHTISLLENMPYNMLFTQVQIFRSPGAGGKNKWEGNITATLLSFIGDAKQAN